MRKLLFMFMLLFTLTSSDVIAQNVQWYQTTEFAYKLKGYDWSDWEPTKMNVKMDLSQDKITIYSNDVQIYRVISTETPPYDPSGQQVKFGIVDQDGDYGYLRLRIENNGNSQIYVDFNDISWVYNVIRIR